MIKVNKIQCNHCKDIVESRYGWDYVSCSCGRVAADGGKEYLRRTFVAVGDFTELSEYTEDAQNTQSI